MTQDDLALIRNHLKKQYRSFHIVVALITIVELILIVRGIFSFDLSRTKHLLYFLSYIFLFVTSLASFVILLATRKQKEPPMLLIVQVHIYAVALFVWATFVSIMDCVASGDSSIMVYLMTSISLGALTRIKPRFFTALVLTSAIALLGNIYHFRGALYSSGFYINFCIFMALVLFINSYNYRLSRREFLASKKLEVLSYTDQLTGAFNRRSFDEHMTARMQAGAPYLLILLDIDDFKTINDTHGHAIGDDALLHIADALRTHFGNAIYRFGGDEFAILSDLVPLEAGNRIDHINGALDEAYPTLDLHISAGIYAPTQTDSVAAVLTRTDQALYEAKRSGKRKWVIYTPSLVCTP